MGKEDLNMLLEAENKARQKVQNARKTAKKQIERAESESRKNRQNRIEEFSVRRRSVLEETKNNALIEAERIRKEGHKLAEDMRSKARGRIPKAVNSVLEHIRES